MKLNRRKYLLIFFLLSELAVYGQLKELNLYLGAQSLDIKLNDFVILEPEWSFERPRAAFSSEFSVNYCPFNGEHLFFQSGLQYFRLNGQQTTFDHVAQLNGIDLGGSPEVSPEPSEYIEIDYGFNFQYVTYFVSPTYSWSIGKSMNVTFGVGGIIYLASTKQKGYQVFTNPDSYALNFSQFENSYQDYGFGYKLTTSVNKTLSDRLGISLKAEYNAVKTTIGEDSRSVLYYGNTDFVGQNGIAVPIHKQTLDLSGFNLMIGVTFQLIKTNNSSSTVVGE